MTLKSIVSFLIISILLAACSAKTPTSTQPVVTENPTVPPTQSSQPTQASLPTQSGPATAYPEPSGSLLPTIPAYPEPGTTGSSSVIPLSGYEPQPGDEKLKRDKVTLDLTTSQLVVTVTDPPQAKAVLVGSMPDPCHSLRVVVTPADANNTIKHRCLFPGGSDHRLYHGDRAVYRLDPLGQLFHRTLHRDGEW